MPRSLVSRIAVIGDRQPDNPTHAAIASAVAHADAAVGTTTSVTWVATDDAALDAPAEALAGYAGLWIAPGSPYRNINGALRAIRYAREADIPVLGTCAGFQHMVLELARNVLGFADAAHAEYDPYASRLFVTALSCSLVGQTMAVELRSGTRAGALYPETTTTERYYCNFGLAPQHVDELTAAGVVVSGIDHDGEPRIIELADKRFFVGTLFVPQTSSSPTAPHPIVAGFVTATARRGELTAAATTRASVRVSAERRPT
jgi:CTP synthase (UTP-ammonia lyase)